MKSPLHEASILARYSLPLVITQVGIMTLGLVDIWMVGKLGSTALASVALGDLWVAGTLLVAMGVLLGIDPIVSQAHGARDGRRIALALQQGVVLALVLSVPLTVAWLLTERILVGISGDAEISREAHGYVEAQLFSIAPHFVFVVLRQYLVGRAILTPTIWVVVIANLFNLLANWALIFGNLGFPALGVNGAGIATGLTRVLMMIALLVWIVAFRLYRGAWAPWSRASFSLRGLRRILGFGLPVFAQVGLEVWAFVLAGFFASHLGARELASHTIVLRLASLSFMVPLGISIACVTRVGNLIGAGERLQAQRSAWVALAIGTGVMGISATIFILFREWLPEQFTRDPEIIALSASILPVAAAFQLFDGAQVVGCGVLRGMGNTVPAAVFSLLSYYGIALPFGWWLTFHRGVGLPGIWWGLCIGLGAVSVLLLYWIGRRGPARAVPARVEA